MLECQSIDTVFRMKVECRMPIRGTESALNLEGYAFLRAIGGLGLVRGGRGSGLLLHMTAFIHFSLNAGSIRNLDSFESER
jgi:hypothetical protein